VLGTDFHRIDRGDATLGEGYAVLEKKFGSDIIKEIEENSKKILSDYSIEDILD
jgi:tyrosine-protein phosphatase YwqE